MFKIVLNNLAYKNYKVFVSPYNSKIWGSFSNLTENATHAIDITFNPVPVPEIIIPKRDA